MARKHHLAEEKIRIVLAGLRGEESISALGRREGIAESPYYSWSKEFLVAGSRRFSETMVHPTSRPRRPTILKTNARIMFAARRITRRPKAKSSDSTKP